MQYFKCYKNKICDEKLKTNSTKEYKFSEKKNFHCNEIIKEKVIVIKERNIKYYALRKVLDKKSIHVHFNIISFVYYMLFLRNF